MKSATFPISDPKIPMDAASSARDGVLAATRITSASMPEATGMPAESMNANTRMPNGPNAMRAAVSLASMDRLQMISANERRSL